MSQCSNNEGHVCSCSLRRQSVSAIDSVKDLVQQLEQYRLENKISQEELAKQLGVAFSTVNRWFNGKSKPNKIQSYHISKLVKNREEKGE
jgi:DNA-binding transcriptional regulator YiaG